MKISKSSLRRSGVKIPPQRGEGNVLFLNLWSRKCPSSESNYPPRFEEETAKAEAKQQSGQ